jgi:hypothetical protein
LTDRECPHTGLAGGGANRAEGENGSTFPTIACSIHADIMESKRSGGLSHA